MTYKANRRPRGSGYVEWARITGQSISAAKHSFEVGYCTIPRKNSCGKKHPLYTTYIMMLQRRYNSNASNYNSYDGEYIKVCAEWFYSFDDFVADMGDRPEGHTLDRINNKLGYSKGNCRWATGEVQQLNRNFKEKDVGERNIYYSKRDDKWKVCFYRKGAELFLGQFHTIEEARAVKNNFLKEEANK